MRLIGGVDISCRRFDAERWVAAAVVVLTWPDLVLVETATARVRARLPYVPGYLGFREVPALLEAWAGLAAKPDLLLVDGQGLAHPRGFGVASHLGVVLDRPTIGVAKSILVGEVGPVRGDEAPLIWQGDRIGTALTTRAGAGPVYVSVGHRVSLEAAVGWVRGALRGYRLPEPTRLAHQAANAARRAGEAAG